MNKETVIDRLKGLIDYCESVREDLESDGNNEGVAEYTLDIEALKYAIELLSK